MGWDGFKVQALSGLKACRLAGYQATRLAYSTSPLSSSTPATPPKPQFPRPRRPPWPPLPFKASRRQGFKASRLARPLLSMIPIPSRRLITALHLRATCSFFAKRARLNHPGLDALAANQPPLACGHLVLVAPHTHRLSTALLSCKPASQQPAEKDNRQPTIVQRASRDAHPIFPCLRDFNHSHPMAP